MLDAVSEYHRLDYCQSRYDSDIGATDEYDDKLNYSVHDAFFDRARVQNYTEEELCERGNPSVDAKVESMGIDDALTRLLEVQKV
uniref:Uncharacterized protein n=1 Tax=Peronospora matthiolae TaxID=2874970 RepID=A0AAV1T748_9STRA